MTLASRPLTTATGLAVLAALGVVRVREPSRRGGRRARATAEVACPRELIVACVGDGTSCGRRRAKKEKGPFAEASFRGGRDGPRGGRSSRAGGALSAFANPPPSSTLPVKVEDNNVRMHVVLKVSHRRAQGRTDRILAPLHLLPPPLRGRRDDAQRVDQSVRGDLLPRRRPRPP